VIQLEVVADWTKSTQWRESKDVYEASRLGDTNEVTFVAISSRETLW